MAKKRKSSILNSFLKKHQPIIQTIGIIIIAAGFAYTIIQVNINRASLKISQEQFENEHLPKWKTEIIWNKENALEDVIIFSNANTDYNIQKIKFTILNKSTPIEFETYKLKFSTEILKKTMVDIIMDFYDLQDSTGISVIEKVVYPLAVSFFYEQSGLKKESTVLYDYVFKVYLSSGNPRIKTIGFEFQKNIENDSISLIKELMDFNLKSSLAECSYFEYLIEEDKIKQDSALSTIYEFAKSNLEIQNLKFIFLNPIEVNHLRPYCLSSVNELNKKEQELKKIYLNRKNYNYLILEKCYTIVNMVNLFSKHSDDEIAIAKDSIRENKTYTFHKKDIGIWIKRNKELIELLHEEIRKRNCELFINE